MRTQREYYEVVSGDAHDEIAAIYAGEEPAPSPDFIENETANAEMF